MNAALPMIQKSKLFAGLPEDVLEKDILPRGNMQEYQRDQFLLVPGQQADRIGFVISGRVQILHLFENGSRSLMSVIGQGGLVGTDLICTHSRISPYHALAAGKVQIFYLPADVLLAPGSLPEQARITCLENLLTLISQENMKKEYRLAILSQNGLRERITTYLTMQARRRHEKTFSIPFSREEMASFLCVNRSALSHELSRMQQEGLISFRKNVFTINGRQAE